MNVLHALDIMYHYVRITHSFTDRNSRKKENEPDLIVYMDVVKHVQTCLNLGECPNGSPRLSDQFNSFENDLK